MTEVQEILTHYKIEFEPGRRPSELAMICPFHDDHSFGSAFFNEDTGIFNCFSCHVGGNIYQFVSKMESCTMQKAQQLIESGFNEFGEYSWDRYDRVVLLAEKQKFTETVLYRRNLDVIISKIFNSLSSSTVDPYKILIEWYPILSHFYFLCDTRKITSDKPLIEMYELFCKTLTQEKSCQM